MAGTVTVTVQQISDSGSEGRARDFRVKCDRPVEKGGANAGPMGGEIFLMGLGGCFMSNLLAAIKARSSSVTDVEVSITGLVDGTPARFTEVSLKVSASYEAREEIEKLVVIAERGCLVANTIKHAVQLTITVD